MSLDFTTRTQYTFRATDRQIAELLTLNVKSENNPHRVNVVTMSSTKCSAKSKKSLVKIIVGTDDPHNPARGGGGDPEAPDPERTNELQNKQFRQNMREIGICYTATEVIQIFNVEPITGTPGIFRIYVASLFCAGITLIAFYQGERVLLFPLQTCECPLRPKFDDEVLSAFIEVPEKQLAAAVRVLANLKLATPEAPFDENQLCINANNITAIVKRTQKSRQKKCHECGKRKKSKR